MGGKTTFREWAERYYFERGMFKDQAKACVAEAEASPSLVSMGGRWDHDVAGYPASMTRVLGISLDLVALKWIDRECPQAWFRDVFDRAKPETA